MKLLACVLLCTAALLGQATKPTEQKVCKVPTDNVYRDGPCEMYHSCGWSGRKYRAEGYCFKVLVTAPETKSTSHREVIDICNDKTGKPRSCQKEFDERGESTNEDECWQRHFAMYKQEFYAAHSGGFSYSDDDLKNFIEEQILMDRPRAIRECAPPKEKE